MAGKDRLSAVFSARGRPWGGVEPGLGMAHDERRCLTNACDSLDRSVTVVKLGRNVWLSILVWVLLLVALIVGMLWIGIDSVVFGGALGAFCGATLVVGYAAWERAQARSRNSR